VAHHYTERYQSSNFDCCEHAGNVEIRRRSEAISAAVADSPREHRTEGNGGNFGKGIR